jgi:hypothetical protein
MMNSSTNGRSEAYGLLVAIVQGDASIEDGLQILKAGGVNSLDEALAILQQGIRERKAVRANAARPVSLKRDRGRSSLNHSITRPIPEDPFILNGTLYDPQDISRFNDRHLSFFHTPDGEPMMVVDDRELMDRWLQISYLERQREQRNDSVEPLSALPPTSFFFTDINLRGGIEDLVGNYGFPNLLEVSWGLFDDWNDKISSVRMRGTQVVVLWSDIDYAGDDYVIQPPFGTPVWDQNNVGYFNDRASSVETF